MKNFLTGLFVLSLTLLLNSCGEWDNLVDSISGSDDDETTTAQVQEPRKDVSQPETKPTTDTTKPTTDTTKPTNDKDTAPKPEYDEKATYTSYGVRNGGRQAWRINKKGPAFGKKIKVVFSNGHTVYVKDTSHNYRESDGFVFKPGIGPNGEGVNDTGTAHGGVYLHAPYGNSSKQVTFYY
jgi:hypothetical protein